MIQFIKNAACGVLHRICKAGTDDRGAVFWLAAILLFLSLALFGMVYDTQKFIEKKMIAQNAADAAALEMVMWQARGLNMVQEVNTDIYEIDTIMKDSIILMSCTLAALDLAIAGTGLSFQWEVTAQLVNFRSGAFTTICKVILNTFKVLRYTTVMPLKGIRYCYYYGTNAIGYLGAINAAALNGASPIYGKDVATRIARVLPPGVNTLPDELKAAGIPLAARIPFTLPVTKQNDTPGKSSLNTKKGFVQASAGHLRIFLPATKPIWGENGKSGWFPWDDEYFQSDPNKPYPGWLWVTRADPEGWLMSDTFLWRKNKTSPMPVPYAYAISQARGGNIVCYVNNKGSRKLGNGAGVEGSLIPVSELKNWNAKFTAFLENLMLMH